MQQEWEFVLIENLVPEDHPVRKLHAILDLDFIYEETRKLYSKLGRPSIDPVVLVKFLLIGYLFGIPSERKIEEEIQVNNAYRLYLGLNLSAPVPDHSTVSQNRRRRPAFRWFSGDCLRKWCDSAWKRDWSADGS